MNAAVWIEGLVDVDGNDGDALVVDAELRWAGVKEPVRLRRAARFVLITDDGTRIAVTCAEGVVLAPERYEAGPWHQIERHPIRPRAEREIHPDGAVELVGGWVVPGDRVAVRGQVTDHAFVGDTGGLREAPATRPSAMAASGIGVGDDGRAALEAEIERRERARRRRRRIAAARS